ncbi:MAG: OsmC family protein [Acidobacteriota bacterium]
MAVDIQGKYQGNLKVRLQHGPSGQKVTTAAPIDNQGDGSSFSPTDLVAAALGACMVTLVAIVGEREGIDCSGVSFRLEKHMNASPRRIGSVPVTILMPPGLSDKQRTLLERAALTCPVHRSLHPEVEKPVTFDYGA